MYKVCVIGQISLLNTKISLLCARRVNGDYAVAGNDARSRVWAVSGGSDTIGPSYGPI
jgi:hypothetical protein